MYFFLSIFLSIYIHIYLFIYPSNLARTARIVNMVPLLARDGSTLANGQIEEYLQKNLETAKVPIDISTYNAHRHRFSSFNFKDFLFHPFFFVFDILPQVINKIYIFF